MKPIKLLLVTLALTCISTQGKGQIEFNTSNTKTYVEEFDQTYHIRSSDLPNGYLYDRVYPTADLEHLGPCDTLKPENIFQGWWEMEQSNLFGQASFHYQDAYTACEIVLLQHNLPIIGLDYSASAFITGKGKEDFEEIDGRWTPKAGSNVFRTFRAQMAGFARAELQAETDYLMYFDDRFFARNTGSAVDEIRVTNYSGQQTYKFRPGEVITLRFDQMGDYSFGIEITLADKQVICNKTTVTVGEKLYKKLNHCEDGEMFLVESDIPFKGLLEENATTSIADAHIYYHRTPEKECKVIRPVLVVDGFDPMDKRNSKMLYQHVRYDNKNKNLIEDLQNRGYDVIILNFPILGSEAIQFKSEVKQYKDGKFERYANLPGRDGGADYVERNAFLTVKLIQTVNGILEQNESDEDLVVVGPSMGGLVTRYALAYMEKEQVAGASNMEHNTRLWISFDSPHNGANIPLSMQNMVDYFGNYKGEQTVVNIFNQRLRSRAARQLLIDSYEAIWSKQEYKSQNHHMTFYKDLASNGLSGSDGWPQNVRKVSVLNGNLNGDQSFKAGDYDLLMVLENNGIQRFRAGQLYSPEKNQKGVIFEGLYAEKKISFFKTTSKSEHDGRGNTIETLVKQYPLVTYHATRVTVTNNNRMGSLDILPGALYPQVNEITNMLNQVLEAEKSKNDVIRRSFTGSDFTFIPSVSAAGLKTTDFLWNKSFSDQDLVCSNLTYFDNYYVPDQDEFHMQVTVDNARWILQEVDRGQPGCQKVCATKDNWPTVLCKNVNTDLKLKIPATSTNYGISWGMDQNISLVSGQGKQTATVAPTQTSNSHPFFRVSAFISPQCGADDKITQLFEVPNQQLKISGNDKICVSEDYEAGSASTIASLFWYYGDVHGTYKTYNPYNTIAPPTNSSGSDARFSTFGGSRAGNYMIYADAKNLCNETMSAKLPVTIYTKSQCDNTLKGFDEFDREKGGLIVYPNPTANHWSVYLNNTEDRIEQLMVFNMNGQMVQHVEVQPDQLIYDLVGSDLPNGFYFIRVLTQNGEQIEYKLVKRPEGL